MITTWMGRPVSELDRDELLNVIAYCSQEVRALRDRQCPRCDFFKTAGITITAPIRQSNSGFEKPERVSMDHLGFVPVSP